MIIVIVYSYCSTSIVVHGITVLVICSYCCIVIVVVRHHVSSCSFAAVLLFCEGTSGIPLLMSLSKQ